MFKFGIGSTFEDDKISIKLLCFDSNCDFKGAKNCNQHYLKVSQFY